MSYLSTSGSDNSEEFSGFLDWVLGTDPVRVDAYVQKLRSQNPGISNDDLAAKVVSRRSLKNGLVGALTGLGGAITLPITIPADIVASWRIQAFTAMAVANVYGHTPATTDLKTDLYLILVGDTAKETLKRMGIAIGEILTRKAVQRYITREFMERISLVLGRKIITKAGTKSMTSFVRMVPLVGAVVGFGFDWFACQAVGDIAIRYYCGRH